MFSDQGDAWGRPFFLGSRSDTLLRHLEDLAMITPLIAMQLTQEVRWTGGGCSDCRNYFAAAGHAFD